jgi:glucuronokinase
VHNDLRRRFERGEPDVRAIMTDLASLADEARTLLVEGRGRDLPGLMDANFELRARLVDVGPGNRRLVAVGRSLGAGVKQAGSGGAVVGAWDGDPDRLAALRSAYRAEGARFLTPIHGEAPGSGRP